MAIYHLSAKVISRGEGRSAVAAAAYRAGSELVDERSAETFDYTRKEGVEHTEILAPTGAPSWVFDRQQLWNQVEASERRKDAQLAREFEAALPVELSKAEQVELIRAFAVEQFVSRGMVVDLAVHRDNPENPHAHLMLTMRSIGPDGFGPKVREWNDRGLLMTWREAWATLANEHLARAGHDVRIDHRSYSEQGLGLEPQAKIGVGRTRQGEASIPDYVAARVEAHRRIAHENGARIVADPSVALTALTHQRATFTEHDLVRFLHTRTDGAEQFHAALLKVKASAGLVRLGVDEQGKDRFTTAEMLSVERQLLERAERMAGRSEHRVSAPHQTQVLAENGRLSAEQRGAFQHVVGGRDLAVLVGVAGSGKSTLLAAARHGWEAEGLTVKGAALSGMAAENLEGASGIGARTIASWERSWELGREPLTQRDVLVIDEAGLVGTRQLARVLEQAEKAGAKVVLVGDPEQLQAIEAGAPFRGIAAAIGVAEMREVHRQALPWQREATKALASGQTRDALAAYREQGHLQAFEDRETARAEMLRAWANAWAPGERERTQLMLAYTRADVRSLNEGAREIRRSRGELGHGEAIETTRGTREFAAGDRIAFLRNERSLGVKNGTLGTVEKVASGVLQVRLDGDEKRRLAVDAKQYADLDHGYASTVHKSQGVTVDRTLVLATPHFDRHATYVALSRHRGGVDLYYGEKDFRGEGAEAARNLDAVLSRARPKELAHDFLEREEVESIRMPSTAETLLERSKGAETSRVDAFKDKVAARAKELADDRRQREREDAARRAQVPRTQTRDLERERDPAPAPKPQKDKDRGYDR